MATHAELRLRFLLVFLEALARHLADRVGVGRVPAGAWRRDRIPRAVLGERDDLFHVALTIGYGDLVPKRITSRMIVLAIGFSGILLTGLVAALGVRSLQEATKDQ